MDSDDENDRRRRDKFRRERNDYSDRRDRDTRRRDDWSDRRRRDNRDMRDWNRRDYQDRGRRDRYSPPPRDMSPPSKRMRRDWDSGSGGAYNNNYNMQYGGGGGGGGGGGNQGYNGPQQGHGGWGTGGGIQHMQQGPHHGNQGQRVGPDHDHGRSPHGPHIMSFKQFLASQDDMIDDTEAVRKYNEYKVEFKRTQLSEFFLAHKEEEWFRSKYYPDEAEKGKAEGLRGVKKRLLVFLELFEEGFLEKLKLQLDKTDDISRLLDAAVIKMEGGSALDLKALDQVILSPRRRMTSETQHTPQSPRGKAEVKKEESKEEKTNEKASASETDKKAEEEEEEEESKLDDSGEITSPKEEDVPKSPQDEPKDTPNGEDKPKKGSQDKRAKKRKRHRDSDYENDSGSSSGSSSSGLESDSDPDPEPPGLDDDVMPSDKLEEAKATEKAKKEAEEDDGELKDGDKEGEDENEPVPRPLHKTYSLFIRNVSPTITKQEIISLCKRYPGFMRVALAEPQPERNFQRHGWVTFDRSVNIKEICWNVSSIRLRECELSPVVNRDLANRIRSVSGITTHKKIVRSDLKLTARLIQQLDENLRLWHHEDEVAFAKEAAEKKIREEKRKEEEKKKKEEEKLNEDEGEKKEEGQEEVEKEVEEEKEPERIIIPTKYQSNPILENITDYLVEEVSAEEDALMGAKPEEEGEETSGEVMFLKDDELNKVLDRLIMYLRIVHSVDYYNASQYHIEDEMPNRCGIIHSRGHNPPSRITHKDLTNWQTTFEAKLSSLLNAASDIPDEELTKLGKKDQEAEVEKFVRANAQEMGRDKWLCPLSGKKFRGPEFVRKHIFNKHSDKVDDVKKEVAFFNNYLKDPNRPQLPDPQAQKPSGGGDRHNQGDVHGSGGSGGMGFQQQQQPQQFGNQMMGFGGQQQQGGNFGNRGGSGMFNQGQQFGQQQQPQQQQQQQQQPPSFQRGAYSGGGFNRQRSRFTKRGDQQSTRKDPRHIVNYRDLDAPNDDDFF